jgi:hypothetical protein
MNNFYSQRIPAISHATQSDIAHAVQILKNQSYAEHLEAQQKRVIKKAPEKENGK